MAVSKSVPVRLNVELLNELEYLVRMANQDTFFNVTQSDVIRIAIQTLANSVRKKGSFHV